MIWYRALIHSWSSHQWLLLKLSKGLKPAWGVHPAVFFRLSWILIIRSRYLLQPIDDLQEEKKKRNVISGIVMLIMLDLICLHKIKRDDNNTIFQTVPAILIFLSSHLNT